MGVVYRAEDPDIGRTVAIKLVHADLLDGADREDFLARFRHEARAAGRCSHPNIVALYDFAMHEGNPFLAMEYVDGEGLGQALKRAGRFTAAIAVSIAGQVLDALGAAHALGVVHRDIKPENIMLLANNRVKVADFGISRLNTSELTQNGAVIGTPAYMSPEQCRGDNVDARSDLFSVGSVLYELLSGARAFSGRNITEVTHRLLTAEPRDLRETVPDLPAALNAVLRNAMAKPRELRYASAEAMAIALREALNDTAPAASDIYSGDQTVLLARHSPEPVAVDDTVLITIERRLARYVGPLARHFVREAARRTNSREALCEMVSQNIDQPLDRERFLTESMDGSPGRGTSVPAATASAGGTFAPALDDPARLGFSGTQIERAEQALTVALGPIAKLLVKRALPGAATEVALWERLSVHVQGPADREAFLRQRPGR